MPKTVLTSREVNHDIGRAKRAALQGPVVITDRGKPSFVLTTFEDHAKRQRKGRTVRESLAMPEDDIHLELEMPRGGFYERHLDLD